jgi:DNA-binding response OmpR family regulator
MRILVIEDERRLANIIKRGLVEEGYAVDNAYDGVEAEYMVESIPYSALILDIMLPKKDGISVCRSLRSKRSNVPILMLTARDTLDDRITGLDSGADDYMVKPFVFSELAARIRALTRRSSQPQSVKLISGPITMDTLSRETWVGDKKIDLTAKEYAILECFLRHPNVVLTRTMIEQNIWDYVFEGSSNLVDVYIRRLRSKLEDKHATLIETVRGAGYRLR